MTGSVADIAFAQEPALVLGASGMVGVQLLRQLEAAGTRAHAISRAAHPPDGLEPLAHWHLGESFDLHVGTGPWPVCGTVFSAGPLTGLADWLERIRPPGLRRLVALSSTSERSKRTSSDQSERALAACLQHAESRVIDCCDRQDVAWTLLRPTLIWGEGRDRNLSRLAAMARHRRFLPLPAFATGRRQPIRSRDVAAAMIAAAHQPASAGHRLDLPGGEILSYDEMVRRVVSVVAPGTRVVRVPALLATMGIRLARRFGVIDPAGEAMLMRTRDDLVYDVTPASERLRFTASGFQPCREDFPAG